MKNIKLIATDLDGTFLTYNKEISNKNMKAVKKIINSGIYFVPATGRALNTMPLNVIKMGGFDYLITSNGAAITEMKTGKIIYKNQLKSGIAKTIVDYAVKNNIMVEVFVNGNAYTMRRYMDNLVSHGVKERFVKWYIDTRNVVEEYEYLLDNEELVENINLILPEKDRRVEIQEKLLTISDIEITNSIDNNIEIGSKGCSKAAALSALTEILGIKMEEVMSFGDNYNDLDMIVKSGLGIAVSNGEEVIKLKADYITKSNDDDGFAEAVNKFLYNSMD